MAKLGTYEEAADEANLQRRKLQRFGAAAAKKRIYTQAEYDKLYDDSVLERGYTLGMPRTSRKEKKVLDVVGRKIMTRDFWLGAVPTEVSYP